MQLDSLPAQTLLAAARQTGSVPEIRCITLLAQAATGYALHSAFQRELARCGLTQPGFDILSVLLAHEPEAVLRSDLAVKVMLSSMRTDDALIRLEMSQLVQRQRDSQDRRLVWLRLTDAGRQQVTEALRRYIAVASLVTEAMDEQELSASVAISGKLCLGAARLSLEPALSTLD